jgi:glycosyltransferase involved in cell wall biosynthesis
MIPKRIIVLVSNPCTEDARVLKMAEAAGQAGHNVHILATHKPGLKHKENLNHYTIHRIKWAPLHLLLEKPPYTFIRRIGWLKKLVRNFASKQIPFKKYKLFSETFHETIGKLEPDLIHAHDLITLPAAYNAAKEFNAKLIYDAHELELHRNPPLPLTQKIKVSLTEKKYGKKADAVITVGKYVGEEIKKHLKTNKINIIYNSPTISNSGHNFRDDIPIPNEHKVIIYIGKITQGRGVQEILKALPDLPEVHFIAVGPSVPTLAASLQKQAIKLGVADRFAILPPVKHTEVVKYIRGADLGIISVEPVTLSYKYCMPNKLMEMSFANIPILSNDLTEIKEFLIENKNGIIYNINKTQTLAYTITQALETSQNYVMDKIVQNHLHEKYSWDTQRNKLTAIYDKLLK